MKTLLLASALFAGLFGSMSAAPMPFPFPVPNPYHAFCTMKWLFATPCPEINFQIVQQILAFSPLIGCEDCQYTLESATPVRVKANHTSLDGLQGEELIFIFNSKVPGGCNVTAQSTSLTFTSLLDNGRNYCNLQSLLSASGLTSAPGFSAMINEWSCLGYEFTTCEA